MFIVSPSWIWRRIRAKQLPCIQLYCDIYVVYTSVENNQTNSGSTPTGILGLSARQDKNQSNTQHTLQVWNVCGISFSFKKNIYQCLCIFQFFICCNGATLNYGDQFFVTKTIYDILWRTVTKICNVALLYKVFGLKYLRRMSLARYIQNNPQYCSFVTRSLSYI